MCHVNDKASLTEISDFVGLLQLRQQGRLTWECQNELFRQEVEGADDIRLNAPLVSKCMSDKRTFCNDVAPGVTQTGTTLAHGCLCARPLLPVEVYKTWCCSAC